MLTLDVLPHFLQKILARRIDFGLTINPYLCPDMRSTLLLCGMLSVILGQQPSLAWVELADTVYGIANAQDTFEIYIQSRSGNVRRFDLYTRPRREGGSLFLAIYDSVYLDGNGRVQLLRRYGRDNPNDPFELSEERRFSYLGSPALRIDRTVGTPPVQVSGHTLCYGLTIFEGSVGWDFGLDGGAIPTEVYPRRYRIEQVGDSVVGQVVSQLGTISFRIARWARPGACDTFIIETPSENARGKICHMNGRIDSVISTAFRTYYSYDANNRPIRIVDVESSDSDTTFYTYDSQGQLIETRGSGVNDNGPYRHRYLLRYQGAPASLSSVLGGDCLFWDAIQRRGALNCQPAGAFTALRLYDLQGRIVWQGSVRGGETFEVPLTLPPGLYYLHTDVGTARLYLMP
jgi:YD repeat-containing protein